MAAANPNTLNVEPGSNEYSYSILSQLFPKPSLVSGLNDGLWPDARISPVLASATTAINSSGLKCSSISFRESSKYN